MKYFAIISILIIYSCPLFSQGEIPQKYADLFYFLDGKLDDINSFLDKSWDGSKSGVNFALELIMADANRGEALLEPNVINGVKLTLDRYKYIGIKAVNLSINYPVLKPGFPRRSEYMALYKNIVKECRSRGIKIFASVGVIFPDTNYSSLNIDYSGLTYDIFVSDLKEYAQTAIDSLRPDYLTIFDEPGTMETNTGIKFSVTDTKKLVENVLADLNKGTTLIGAGAGTWDNISYFESLADISGLDYLDAHLYPVNFDFFIDKAITISELALNNGKKLALGECWLYKTRDSEVGLSTATSAELFSRDIFSFWEPLDIKFIDAIVKLSHMTKMEFVSLFWIQNLYSYVEWDPQKEALLPKQKFALRDAAAAQNIYTNVLSEAGKEYKKLIEGIESVEGDRTANSSCLLIFPNPANETIKVRYQYGEKIISVSIWNNLGEKVFETCAAEIPIASLPTGLYSIKIETSGGTVFSSFFKQP